MGLSLYAGRVEIELRSYVARLRHDSCVPLVKCVNLDSNGIEPVLLFEGENVKPGTWDSVVPLCGLMVTPRGG